METSSTCRRHSEAKSVSPPHLLRSRSGTTALKREPSVINSAPRSTIRSKSTTRSRTLRNGENINPTTILPSMPKKSTTTTAITTRDGFVRFLQRGGSKTKVSSKSVTNSPSAWALSPGRSSSPLVEPQVSSWTTEVRAKCSKGGGGVSGVLKYFRQKKVSPIQEEEYHQFRVVYNRLLQWRFANARAEAAMAAVNIDSQDKLFGVWLRILKIRNSTLEKRILLHKLRHEIKLHEIVGPQLSLLTEWVKLESRNLEAVSRVIRKLSAVLVRVPLIQDAEADMESMHEAMSAAIEVMDGIEANIINIFSQPVEKILYLVTELISMVEQEKQCLEDMENAITLVPPQVLVSEQSLHVHLIQAAKESRNGPTN
ncbi:QWRF domain containing 7 [Hibiscus trionum]|uniref:QWRF domain containing 7 n=1 Tax=Hibiscus trionum TaxID=183268 RepID=A0A9W7LUT7_HIBTR|nr:QWRF domain containing 7 [Hibiscus trionum]